jgi:hypothetical protein
MSNIIGLENFQPFQNLFIYKIFPHILKEQPISSIALVSKTFKEWVNKSADFCQKEKLLSSIHFSDFVEKRNSILIKKSFDVYLSCLKILKIKEKNISEIESLMREKLNLELPNGLFDPSIENNYAIRWASENGYTEIVELLLNDSRVDPSAEDNQAIKLACKFKKIEIVKLLLEDSRVDPSVTDDPYHHPLIVSQVMFHRKEIVELLANHPKVSKAHINWAVRVAYKEEFNDVEIVQLLIKHPSFNRSIGNDFFKWGIKNGHLEVVNRLISYPEVDVSIENNWAIKCASQNGHIEVVKLLLQDSRIDPSVEDNVSILLASYNGHIEVVKLLLSHPKVELSPSLKFNIKLSKVMGKCKRLFKRR